MRAYIAIKYHEDNSNRKRIEGISKKLFFYNEYAELSHAISEFSLWNSEEMRNI